MSCEILEPEVRARLRDAREALNLTQEEVRTRSGVCLRTIMKIESTEHLPLRVRDVKLKQYCQAIGFPLRAIRQPSSGPEDRRLSFFPASDVFVAAPMDAKGVGYTDWRAEVLAIIEVMREVHPGRNFYCALEELKSPDDYEDESVSLLDNLDRIARSGCLVALYPEKIVTSVLVEIGMAIALDKPTLVIARRQKDLPFLLRGTALPKRAFAMVTFRSTSDIIKLIRHRRELFPLPANGD